jgi:ribonuclease Z
MLGHYSNRYSDKNEFVKEASSIFENVILSEDLKSFSI